MRPRKLGVAGQERSIERFCKRDIGRVIGSQRLAQLPHSAKQPAMRVPFDEQLVEVVEHLPGALRIHDFESNEPTQGLGDLDVEQMGSVKALAGIKRPCADAFSARGPEQQLEQRRSVDDDQRLSRSDRTIAVGDTLPLYEARSRSRSRISSGVG